MKPAKYFVNGVWLRKKLGKNNCDQAPNGKKKSFRCPQVGKPDKSPSKIEERSMNCGPAGGAQVERRQG